MFTRVRHNTKGSSDSSLKKVKWSYVAGMGEQQTGNTISAGIVAAFVKPRKRSPTLKPDGDVVIWHGMAWHGM